MVLLIDYFKIIFIASGFASWGIIGGYSGVNGAWIGAMSMACTTLTIMAVNFAELKSGVPGLRALVLLVIGGVWNGAAVLLYSKGMAKSYSFASGIDTTVFMVSVSIVMVILTPILNWKLNGVTPTKDHVFGFVLTVGAIYFLNK